MPDQGFLHNVNPVLSHVFGINLYYYGLAYAIGFLGIFVWLRMRHKALGWRIRDVYDFSILSSVCVLLFGRLFSVFVYQWDYYSEHTSQIFSYWRGGMATHGVLLGGLISMLVFSRLRGQSFWRLADEIAIPAAFLLAVGRVGNFINGEIIGTATDAWWGVKFPGVEGFRHPVTLYEALKNLTLIPILLLVRRLWPAGRGMMATHFLFWYGFLRILTDLFRDHPEKIFGIGGSQYFNALMAILALALMAALLKRKPPGPIEENAAPGTGEDGAAGEIPGAICLGESRVAFWCRRAVFVFIVLFSLGIRSAWTPEELQRRRADSSLVFHPDGATLPQGFQDVAGAAVAEGGTTMGNHQKTIIDEWDGVKAPPAPELEPVQVAPATTALLILDIQNQNCNLERRPRCVATLSGIQKLLNEARSKGVPVVYSVTSRATRTDIRQEVTPLPEEPVVTASVDKFHGTELETILRSQGVRAVIVVGTAAHGAVLHTAVGAALRGFDVIVPVDGMSADDAYPEQYTAWHLANSPGSRKRTTLTRIDLVTFGREVPAK
jgi:phosphatidylglycerol:prolipoprotein diacylglycerol transferase